MRTSISENTSRDRWLHFSPPGLYLFGPNIAALFRSAAHNFIDGKPKTESKTINTNYLLVKFQATIETCRPGGDKFLLLTGK